LLIEEFEDARLRGRRRTERGGEEEEEEGEEGDEVRDERFEVEG